MLGHSDTYFAGAYIFALAGIKISFSLQLQALVRLPSCEAKHIALIEAGKETAGCACYHAELEYFKEEILVLLRADNRESIYISDKELEVPQMARTY